MVCRQLVMISEILVIYKQLGDMTSEQIKPLKRMTLNLPLNIIGYF